MAPRNSGADCRSFRKARLGQSAIQSERQESDDGWLSMAHYGSGFCSSWPSVRVLSQATDVQLTADEKERDLAKSIGARSKTIGS